MGVRVAVYDEGLLRLGSVVDVKWLRVLDERQMPLL